MAQSVENMGIKVTGNQDCVKIIVPCLLPHKKAKNNDFIIEPLLYAMETFVTDEDFTKLDDCVIWVKYWYDAALGEKAIRDYDNLELSGIINIIALYLMIDDSGKYCSMYHSTEVSNHCCPAIEVMTRREFRKRLNAQTHDKRHSLFPFF